ncbi:MAG: hypothetical protein ACK5AZ_17320 [Bryobacteraceae bacterium]
MKRLSKCLLLFLSIVWAASADKDQKFAPRPASSYENKQTISKLTIAASVFETAEQAKQAFGKLHPYEHGILPVLVVMQNDSDQPLSLENMSVEYLAPDRNRIEPTPPQDVPYTRAPKRPNMNPSPIPLPKKKNPLAAYEIEGRAFRAKMLLPGESAHGFFYFQTGHRSGSVLYVTGIREASSGKEIFYFEVPLSRVAR